MLGSESPEGARQRPTTWANRLPLWSRTGLGRVIGVVEGGRVRPSLHASERKDQTTLRTRRHHGRWPAALGGTLGRRLHAAQRIEERLRVLARDVGDLGRVSAGE